MNIRSRRLTFHARHKRWGRMVIPLQTSLLIGLLTLIRFLMLFWIRWIVGAMDRHGSVLGGELQRMRNP